MAQPHVPNSEKSVSLFKTKKWHKPIYNLNKLLAVPKMAFLENNEIDQWGKEHDKWQHSTRHNE